MTFTSQKMRDIEMLDKTLQTISGQAKVAEAKISNFGEIIQQLMNDKKKLRLLKKLLK
jgi:hypothetical protein